MAEIRLDAEQMNYYAQRLIKYREDLEELLKKLDDCMGRLSEEWAGDAYNEYYNQYEQIKGLCEATIEYIQRFADAMIQTYKNFNDVDTQLASAIKS